MFSIFSNKEDFSHKYCDTVVLPIGAVEQHGQHLPIGTDYLIASEFAKRLAEKLEAYLLPGLPVSCSSEHSKCKATVYIKAKTLMSIIEDIADSLDSSEYRRLVIVNGHGGNWAIKPVIREINHRMEKLQVIYIQTMSIAYARISHILDNTSHDIHAGEKETSIMKYLYDEYVSDRSDRAFNSRVTYPQDFLDYFDICELTKDGTWGFPETASADKGREILRAYVECAMEYLHLIETTENELRRCKKPCRDNRRSRTNGEND